MTNDFELIQQYKRACEYAIKKEKIAYILEWTFIKNLICKAYGIEKGKSVYPDNESDSINVKLINDNIEDADVRNIMHSIRQNRNCYEHRDTDYLEVPNINIIKKELDQIINYINNNCNNRYQFVGKYITLRIEEDKNEVEKSLKQIIEIEKKEYSYTVYNNAYERENSYFIVDKFVNKCKNPIFAVIHNILIRSDNIKLNNILLEEKLSIYEKEEVYKFQIALLLLLAESESNQFIIRVSNKEEKIARVALKNIMYYYEIISKMTCNKEKNLFKLIVSDEINFNSIEVNNEIINIIDLKNSEKNEFVNNSHVLISNTYFKYVLNANNEKYYNILLNEIFEIKEFRKGQFETLKKFFEDNKPLMSILPTGYGKSLIYQFVAMIYPKIMWVVSPDEFLVNDQLSNLTDKNIYRASYITDTGTIKPRIIMKENEIPIFRSNINYIIADGILSDKIMKILRALTDENYISAISIDECHKTSIWGHQFSSRYATLIKQLIEYVPECKFLLLSATVATRVKKEILGQIKEIKIIQPCPLKRDNIKYDIQSFEDINNIVNYIESRYKESSNLSGEISDLSIVVNNDENILSEIMNQLRAKEGLSDKCFLFDGDVATYEEFKISHRAILFVTDDYLTGINVNNLNNLFIIGMPISKEWFYQQSGRVGRYLKDGFVSVLLLNEENIIVNNIINNELKQFNKLEIKECVNHTNLTEVTNPIFEYDENVVETACKTIKEIKKCIFIPTGETQGRVIGRIPDGMFGLYDMPLYILLYMGIIKSLRYLQEEETDIIYRIYVDPNTKIWFHASKNKIRKNIMYESYNDDIERMHLNELEKTEKEEDVVKVVLHWLDYNGLKLKREMFKNIYKLIMQNKGNTDTEYIENDITNYFSVGSDNIVEYEDENQNGKLEEQDNIKEEVINLVNELEFNDTIQDNIVENSENVEENQELNETILEEINNNEDEINQENNKNENKELIEFLQLKPENLEIIINLVKEDISKYRSEFKAHVERSIEEKYSKVCLVALCVYELLDVKERVFLRLKELNKEDRILFYELLNKIKEELELTKVYWIDKFLIENKYAFSFVPLRYYTFYEIPRAEEDIIKDIELIEDKISKVEAILSSIYNEGKHITALKGLAIIDINHKKLSSLDNFEKLVELKDYFKLLEIEKNRLNKREKIIIDEFLKNKNENRYYYYGLLGLIKMLIEK